MNLGSYQIGILHITQGGNILLISNKFSGKKKKITLNGLI